MAIKVYNPRKKAFVAFVPPDVLDIPINELIMLNIMIELKAIVHYLENEAHPADPADTVRQNIVSTL